MDSAIDISSDSDVEIQETRTRPQHPPRIAEGSHRRDLSTLRPHFLSGSSSGANGHTKTGLTNLDSRNGFESKPLPRAEHHTHIPGNGSIVTSRIPNISVGDYEKFSSQQAFKRTHPPTFSRPPFPPRPDIGTSNGNASHFRGGAHDDLGMGRVTNGTRILPPSVAHGTSASPSHFNGLSDPMHRNGIGGGIQISILLEGFTMVRATVLNVGDHASEGVRTNKAKGEKMVLEPPMNSAQRRKLGDITNLQNQKNLMNQGAKHQQQAILISSKENAENLQKENTKLMKVVMERDGIKSDLKKLRIEFQKVQEQNLLLAQANTRILAEFNTSKDQLKVLQHELGCKNGLVMARKMLLKEQTLPCTRHASKVKAQANACGGACKTFQPNDADHEHASGSSNANSLQRNEKANSKRRVSGRKNPANSEVLDIIGRSGETCQMEDNIDNKKLVSDSDNDAENHINDNVQSKRYCAGRQSSSSKTREASQTETLQKVVDAKEIKGDARFSLTKHSDWLKSQEPEPSESLYESRFPLRRRSARLKSQEPEPSESFHDSIETTKRRRSAIRSAMFNIQELGVIQNLNGLPDDQEIAAKARCSAREQSTGSKPEAVEPHDTKEIIGKSRISLRRQSARFNFQELGVTENLNGPHDDQTIAANARCCASEQSIGSKPEAVEPHDIEERIGKIRVSSRRQSANIETPRAIKEPANPPLHDDNVEESSQISCSVSMELKRESKKKPTGDESEEMRKTTVGRPSRQAAEKIKSYKEPSLKEKMRGGF